MEADAIYLKAFELAGRFLDRCPDPFTASRRDELSQDAAIEAWRRRDSLRYPDRLGAFVWQIARRVRARAIAHWYARREPSSGFEVADRSDTSGAFDYVRVDSVWCDREPVSAAVERELRELGGLNELLVRGFYEGFSQRELAARYALDEDVVKVRLYRARRRIRQRALRRLRSESAFAAR